MPRRGKSALASPSQVTRAFFRVYTSAARSTSGTTVTRLNLSAINLGTRIADIAATFEYYRITKLHAYTFTDSVAVQSGSAAAVVHALAYINTPSNESSAPASIATMAQSEYFSFANSAGKTSIRVPMSALVRQSPEKWFATYSTGTPTEAQSPGTIIFLLALGAAVTNNAGLEVIVEGEIEFAVPNEPTLTRQRLRDIEFGKPVAGPELIRDDTDGPNDEPKRKLRP